MDKNKKILVISGAGILVMILSIIGVTYAWFSSDIDGSGANFNVTTATVGPLTYTGTEITAEGVLPGWVSDDADLKVEGTVTGDQNVGYTCYIENTGEVTDVEYRISGDGANSSKESEWRNIEDKILVNGIINSTNSIDEYKLAVRFKETGLDQNDQQGKTLSVNVTCEVVDASIDANIVAWTLDGKTQTGEMPQNGELYKVDSVICTNGATGTWNNVEWNITIDDMTNTPINCTINVLSRFKEGTLASNILEDNPNRITRETFAIYTESNNGNTIHKEFGQDGLITYYFAGNVTNNYVLFANKWWRIIRINEDDSVRLLYYGTDNEGSNMYPSTSAFNAASGNSISVGYEYATNTQHGIGTNSEPKTYLEYWYSSNLASYDTYISRTAIYCNDRTIEDGTWSATGTAFDYAGYTRYKNGTPTFACSNEADKFTGSIVTGNGELGEKPIGLITMDEVIYAGGYGGSNTSYYISQNSTKITDVTLWWTMTPTYWQYNYVSSYAVGGATNYIGGLTPVYVFQSHGIRPVISLKSCVSWSKGDGTSGSPYEVTVDEACASSEN